MSELLEELTVRELVERAHTLRRVLQPRMPRRAHGMVNVSRGQVVAGTGRAEVVTNPEVRKLIEDIRAAGGTVTRATDSHWKVEHEGKTANISSTPRGSRSVLNDRSRVRRKLGLDV